MGNHGGFFRLCDLTEGQDISDNNRTPPLFSAPFSPLRRSGIHMKAILSLLLCLCFGLPSVTARAADSPREFTATVFPVWILLHEIA